MAIDTPSVADSGLGKPIPLVSYRPVESRLCVFCGSRTLWHDDLTLHKSRTGTSTGTFTPITCIERGSGVFHMVSEHSVLHELVFWRNRTSGAILKILEWVVGSSEIKSPLNSSSCTDVLHWYKLYLLDALPRCTCCRCEVLSVYLI